MESLILVGGLQYSGKTTFCRQLEKQGNGKYLHIECDAVAKYTAEHKDVLMGLIRKYDERMYGVMKKFARQKGLDDAQSIDLLLDIAIEEGKLQNFKNIHDTCGVIYIADRIGTLHNGIQPVIEGLMPTRESRRTVYEILKKNLADKLQLDTIRKLFVYFNTRLETSLQRFSTHGGVKNDMITTANKIRETYYTQELPIHGELPNMDVLTITNEDQIGSAIAYIINKF
jgi:adenylate kinase family enzyme